ncbi:glycosyltransferase involved in cell wall biosynthesis [Flavobacterium sp. 28A]|uniref:glycosyltransferase n=1 Tax=Flavobacterium sp. 28A TaxID=2735895 RepID=UPI0015701508|nr:glycosyltransferase [Flavobacterium sp. 28A]NRT15111.1 glycosyltransferase involved in cell wall biosynthesis [Flavobacterium sp. 28A]
MIVFFLPDLRAGGAERVMLNLLLRYHYDFPEVKVSLLLFKKEGPLLGEVPQTIPIYELNTTGASKSVISFVSFCNKLKPNIVFSSLGASLTTSLAKPFIPNDTVIINRIGNTIGAEKLLFKNSIKRFLYIFANKIIAKMSDHVIFQCNYMAADYCKETKVTPKHFSIIYNPVKIDHVIDLASKEIAHRYTFVAVGRLNPQKDYKTLIQAAAILKQRKYEFSVAILGDGNLKADLQHQIEKANLQNEVFLLGHQANPYPYIKTASYLVSSSLYEGFSNVIIESLCLGTPVVATNCPGGNAEVINDGNNGWLCDIKDSEALANTMLNAMQNEVKDSKKDIMQKSRLIFSDDLIFAQYEIVIKKYLV